MLCILQTIRQHMEGDVIKKDAFKIVYVAPMKALAAEMTATFGKRYSDHFVIGYPITGAFIVQLTNQLITGKSSLVHWASKIWMCPDFYG